MTQDQTDGRQPAPSFTPISATRMDAPKQTEFRLVSPAPPDEDEEDPAPTTPVPAVPSQGRRDAADDADDEAAPGEAAAGNVTGRATNGAAGPAARRDGQLAEGEELMPGPSAYEPPPASPGADEPLASLDEEPLAAGLGEGPLADDRPALVPPAAAGDDRPALGSLDDEPLLAGVAELRAGWQRVRVSFVDNPRGAVAEAAGLADEAAEALAAALRERRHRIRATWDGDGPGRDTEALRLALLRYQALFSKIVGD